MGQKQCLPNTFRKPSNVHMFETDKASIKHLIPPDFTSGFHSGSCCPVICVSIFHVSFGFLVLIVPFVTLCVIITFY